MKINNVIIVGGGSSGWMTAALLSKTIPNLKITLIESKNVPIVGVGESTLNGFNRFVDLLGVQEEDWMPRCNAIYKTSIRFTNFFEQGFSYHDTLKQIVPPVDMDVNDFYHLCHQYPDKFKVTDFPKFFDDNHYMTIWNRYTTQPDSSIMNWNPRSERAYHFDAYKFGTALKDLVAIPNGVEHIEDDVYAIRSDENGITCLETIDHGPLTADLYIDCSGFKSLLLGSLGVGLIDFSDRVINDRAIATNIPYGDRNKEMETFTDCIAMSSGWIWNIPIWDRIGGGYVYSSKFTNEKIATEEFRENIRERFGNRADFLHFRNMKFNPGVRESPWYKNVVGIGLSCGFLGPLRSTGLALTQEMMENLAAILLNTEGNIKNFDKEFYNDIVIKRMKLARDWVSAQSALSRRIDTPYWVHRTQNVNNSEDSEYFNKIFDSLLKKEELNVENKRFNISYHRVLAGAGYSYVNKMDYDLRLKQNPTFYNKVQNIKLNWERKQARLQEYTASLPTTYNFLKNRIYRAEF